MKIGILGGGLAGLVAAYYLLENGYKDVEILEKRNEVGGLLESVKINGFTFDSGGSHIIFSKDKNALDFLLKFAGEVVKHRRNTKIYMKGRYIKYPFENGLGDLDKEDRFFALYEYIKAWIAREKGVAKEPHNFKEWLYYWFGKGIAELYLVPYNEKIWKYPVDKIGLDWVIGRVPSPPIEDVIKSALGIPTEGYVHQLNFYYPLRGGIQTIALNLKEKVLSMGGRITTNFNVEAIEHTGDSIIIEDTGEEKRYDIVINTLSVPKLIKMLKDVPNEVVNATERLVWNGIVVVGVGVKKKKLSDYHWVYYPHNAIFHRLAYLSNYSPYMAPKDHSSLIMEITIPKGKSVDVNKIREQAVNDLIDLGIVKANEIVLSEAWYWPFAYIVYHIGYSADMRVILDYLKELRIIGVGRWGSWRYLNMDTVVRNVRDTIMTEFLKPNSI